MRRNARDRSNQFLCCRCQERTALAGNSIGIEMEVPGAFPETNKKYIYKLLTSETKIVHYQEFYVNYFCPGVVASVALSARQRKLTVRTFPSESHRNYAMHSDCFDGLTFSRKKKELAKNNRRTCYH